MLPRGPKKNSRSNSSNKRRSDSNNSRSKNTHKTQHANISTGIKIIIRSTISFNDININININTNSSSKSCGR